MPTRHPLLPLLLLASTLLALPCRAMQLDEKLDEADLPAEGIEADAPDVEGEVVADPEREAITDYLRASLGKPYRFGATGGVDGYDCSGLVLRAYAAAGREVPRVSQDQLRTGNAVVMSELKAGDLLFYRMRGAASASLHVVVYVGGGRAIHASVGHKKVREIDITRKIWTQHLVAARTLL